MGAIVNGLSLSKLRPFGATFFIFSDYRGRHSTVSDHGTANSFCVHHDAMGDGEDGPTHQPVEQLSLVARHSWTSNVAACDANEVVEAYRYVMQLRHKPAVLALSRQPLPTLDRNKFASRQAWRTVLRACGRSGGNPK